jgi:hypothetical protein
LKLPSTDLELAQRIIDQGFEEGALINTHRLCDLLELPHPWTANSPEAGEKMRLAFVAKWATVRRLLLTEHRTAFRAVGAGGLYELVPAAKQAGWAREDGERGIQTWLSKTYMRLNYIKVERLDEDGRRERTNALAHFAQVAAVSRPREKRWG